MLLESEVVALQLGKVYSLSSLLAVLGSLAVVTHLIGSCCKKKITEADEEDEEEGGGGCCKRKIAKKKGTTEETKEIVPIPIAEKPKPGTKEALIAKGDRRLMDDPEYDTLKDVHWESDTEKEQPVQAVFGSFS